MVHPIRMPKPGQMTEECVLTIWHKHVGDPVRRGDILFEIETDKSAMEVEAFDDGVLLARLVEEGQAVPVNAICGYVGAAGEAIPEEALVAASAEPVAAALVPPATAPGMASAPGTTHAQAPQTSSDEAVRFRISPRASRLAAGAGLDPRTIIGSGPEGRIIERDVKAALEGEEEPRPLSRIRRVIADRLTHSWQATPHFTVTVAVDVTRLLALRAELKAGGTNLTITDFVLAATAQTLAEFPDVNSRTDGASVWSRRRVHLGLAVSLPAGLVVPVIRDADRLGLSELHDRAAALAGAAREGTLPIDDMTGGTFTVSNLGMFGVDEFSAIINPGEAAILAVASAIPTVVAVGDAMAIRPIMKLTLSADHRLVDGEMGARFLNALRRRLEDVAAFRSEALNG